MTSTKFSLRFFRDKRVNGRADLPDFFPVWLDLSEALALLDAMPGGGRIEIKLRHDRNALACVPTALSTNDAGAFLVSDVAGLASAATRKITAAGVALPDSFADAVRADPSKGVILIEGRAETTEPLVLEIWRDGRKALEKSLPLRVAPVEQMYRWHNFRASPSLPDRLYEPSGLPDSELANIDVFMAHGFRVSENEARAWGAEFFKRLWQEGSRARFHCVTWSSDTGPAISYEDNVNNAFATASSYAARVNAVKAANQSQVVVMAHSLGCMLTSAAIADHGMQAGKFFALNGAVPAEAFDAAMIDERTNALNRLLHPDWRGYKARTWSANWHRLFADPAAFPDDDRARLNWRGRFANAAPVLYNFWSSGDEVLEIAATDINLGSGVEFEWEWTWPPVSVDARRYVWHKQALFKGRSWAYGTTWAGWGFWEWALPLVGKVYSRDEANALTDDELRAEPVFRHNPDEMFTSNIVVEVRNNLLARGIPELSFPIGATEVSSVTNVSRNIDINTSAFRRNDEAWPRRSIKYGDDEDAWLRWLHTDLINLPHYYTYKLFKKLVEEGDMK